MASLIGARFGRLVVTAKADRAQHWSCVCDCGGLKVVHGTNLKAGRTSSCGCLWREQATRHGAAGTPTYTSWRSMINRCTNPKDPSFDRYGAAGVQVDPAWLEYSSFLADMGERPAGTSIDRVDPFGNYCKDNCRWATAVQQARNQRGTPRLIETPRGPMRVCEASEISGLPVNLIRARMRLNWAPQRLFDPVIKPTRATLENT